MGYLGFGTAIGSDKDGIVHTAYVGSPKIESGAMEHAENSTIYIAFGC